MTRRMSKPTTRKYFTAALQNRTSPRCVIRGCNYKSAWPYARCLQHEEQAQAERERLRQEGA